MHTVRGQTYCTLLFKQLNRNPFTYPTTWMFSYYVVTFHCGTVTLWVWSTLTCFFWLKAQTTLLVTICLCCTLGKGRDCLMPFTASSVLDDDNLEPPKKHSVQWEKFKSPFLNLRLARVVLFYVLRHASWPKGKKNLGNQSGWLEGVGLVILEMKLTSDASTCYSLTSSSSSPWRDVYLWSMYGRVCMLPCGV